MLLSFFGILSRSGDISTIYRLLIILSLPFYLTPRRRSFVCHIIRKQREAPCMKSVEYINCIILKVRGRLTSWRRNNFFSNIIHESLNTSDSNTSVDLIIVALPARSIEYRTQYVYTMHNHILKHFTHHWNSLLPTDHTIWVVFFF